VIATAVETSTEFRHKRFLLVCAVLLGVVSLASLEVVPVVTAALCGVVLLVLAGNMSMKDVFEAIDWRIFFLMAGALSLGLAMQKTGLADRAALGFTALLYEYGGPVAIVSGLYLLTSLLTEVMSNTATAALLTPIALGIAHTLGLDHQPFVMAVVFAASASFMTPIGYQTNTMIYGAGRYKAKDFLRVGLPLQLLFWLVATLLIPRIYPF
jgi:di/tricarboxylate transporter